MISSLSKENEEINLSNANREIQIQELKLIKDEQLCKIKKIEGLLGPIYEKVK